MKSFIYITLLIFAPFNLQARDSVINHQGLHEDLQKLLSTVEKGYVYLDDREIDLACINQKYSKKVTTVSSLKDSVLLFENLLNEFYDSHISLSTNVTESYRLFAPIFTETRNNKTIITNVWQTNIQTIDTDLLGAEILAFNGVEFSKTIDDFPTVCQNKENPEIRAWIANKVVAGKYSEPRVLRLKLKSSEIVEWDLDSIQLQNPSGLLSVDYIDDIALIRINNSLGNNSLIAAFDTAIDTLSNNKALILDLRNTNSGGNTYVAKGIMSRLIDTQLPYQKHEYTESWDNQTDITRAWVELVSPRGKQYTKPVVVPVGRWTGSMGEGLAIGLDAMKRADIVGTQMKRLAGSDFGFRFKHRNFGYKMIVQKLFHVDGTPRELFLPEHFVAQTSIDKDESLLKAIELLSTDSR
jgi:carboxyl-terminal processing protease